MSTADRTVSFSRRDLLQVAALGGFVTAGNDRGPPHPGGTGIKAIAFDALAIFDPRPVFAQVDALWPQSARVFIDAWRSRQFEYTWLRTLTGSYVDFWQVTQNALTFAAQAAKVELTPLQRDRLMQGWLELKLWPDAHATLELLHRQHFRLALLSNFTPLMLSAAVSGNGIEELLELQLSTDNVRAFKPHPHAYRLATAAFELHPEQIAFVAFGGWDAAGAKAFGFRTFWVNRLGQPMEELGVHPDRAESGLAMLSEFVNRK